MIAVPIDLELVQHRTDLGHKVHLVRKDWELLGQLDVLLVDIHEAKGGLAAYFMSRFALGVQSHHKGHRRIQKVVEGGRQNRCIYVWPNEGKQQ